MDFYFFTGHGVGCLEELAKYDNLEKLEKSDG